MADDLDALLQGDEQTSASQAGSDVQQNDSNQVRPLEQQSEEEVEFNRLSGSTQERIRELAKRARDAELRVNTPAYVPPAPMTTPDQRQALETLSNFGVATDEKVNRVVDEKLNTLRWENEQGRLESKYSGQDGTPTYVREEVEDYMRKHPQYSATPPELVFKGVMFPDEFSNVDTKSRTRTSTLRPTKAQLSTAAINPDNVEELVSKNSQQWYEEHLDEINAAVSQHTRQFNQQGQKV